eukprot:m.222907 g.222907  ORF g.222907 m.222907 type:complete len:245 (+) comp10847_c0_seq1:19-753(+)
MADVPGDAGPAAEEELATFDGQKLLCMDRDLDEIPLSLAERYAAETTTLNLSFNALVSLRNLDAFVNLEELYLDNNTLGDDIEFPSLPKLRTLSLNKNLIGNLETFLVKAKSTLPSLTYLSLLFNTACPNELVGKDDEDYQRYRYLVLYSLPNLKFLDSKVVTVEELAEAKVKAPFVRVVRVSDDQLAQQQKPKSGAAEAGPLYSPLPQETRALESHKGTIGYNKYVYFGKHSEGNRFIRNDDL